MSKITPVKYKKYARFLEEIGCTLSRQKASHLIYWRDDLLRPIVFQAKGEVPVSHIKNNLHTLRMSNDQYLEVIERV